MDRRPSESLTAKVLDSFIRDLNTTRRRWGEFETRKRHSQTSDGQKSPA